MKKRKEMSIGELVIYGIKKDLLPRQTMVEVPAPEPIKSEKEMTMEEIMKALKGKSAELIMRVYSRKE